MEEEQENNTLNSILDLLTNEANGNELSHIEVKENNIDPELIGKSISAIANTCTLDGKEKGFLIFGVKDGDLEILGVNFDPFNLKYSSTNQDMDIWLRQMVLGVDFRFVPFKSKEKDFLIIEISKALGRVSTFKKKAYIRIGKNTSELSHYPDIEKKIWSKIDKGNYWRLPVKMSLHDDEVLSLLDFEVYYRLVKLPLPSRPSQILERFQEEAFINYEDGLFYITNLGALLFAREIKNFPSLKYKTPRIITYDGDNKLSTVIKEKEGQKGYACGFEALLTWIDSQIPEPQEVTKFLREQKKFYPEKALRELVANALIHQDCEEDGMRPTIEIYKNHIDISNPGNCLVNPDRILGAIPKARNEMLVDVMKRLYICEARGSGIPRTVQGVEEWQLPAPLFLNQENGFKVSLYTYKTFESLDNEEKLRACVQHVTFMYTQQQLANNETLRKRFGLGEKKTNTISKLVKLAKDQNLIKDFDPKNNSKKYIKYIPYWA